MNGEEPANLYQMVMAEIEKPLLEVVMEHAESNQTRASRVLGINRNTLRKKLKQYDLE
jgi:Fis family transcriptional regulator